jgi:hypothetical protein
LLLLDLLFVSNMLPGAATTTAKHRTRGLHPTGPGFDQCDQLSNQKILVGFDDSNVGDIARSRAGNEDHGAIKASDTAAAMIRKALNFDPRN